MRRLRFRIKAMGERQNMSLLQAEVLYYRLCASDFEEHFKISK